MLWYPRQETTGFITVFHYVSLVSCFESFVMWRANILLEWAWLNTGAKTIPRTHQLVSDRTDNVSLCFVCYLLAHCPSPTSFFIFIIFWPGWISFQRNCALLFRMLHNRHFHSTLRARSTRRWIFLDRLASEFVSRYPIHQPIFFAAIDVELFCYR